MKAQFTREEVLALLAQAYWHCAHPPDTFEEAQQWARAALSSEDDPREPDNPIDIR